MELEKVARKYVQALKGLYVNVSVYALVSVVSFLVWLSFGGAGFWPIWVFLGFGIATVLQGWAIGSIKQLEEILPFLKPEWEEQQLKKILKQPISAKIHPEENKKKEEQSMQTPKAEQPAHHKETKGAPKREVNVPHSSGSGVKKPSQPSKGSKTAPKKMPPKKKPVT